MEHLLSVSASIDPTTLWTSGLSDLLTTTVSACWIREGYGLIGWGEAARYEASGPDRFAQMDTWWKNLVAASDTTHDTEPVAFATVAFADDSEVSSVVVVPEVVLIHRPDQSRVVWQINPEATHIAEALDTGWRPLPSDALDQLAAFRNQPDVPHPGTFRRSSRTDTLMSEEDFTAAVTEAVEMLGTSETLRKVVLSRDLVVSSVRGFEVSKIVRALAQAYYADSWTYLVDGTLGATPELLISRQGQQVSSRVLAGTVDRAQAPADPAAREQFIASELAENPKQQFEHRAAVDSLVEPLTALTSELTADAEPSILQLPNLLHLATDVTGTLADADTSVIRLAQAVHPTAAVGGTPREDALEVIHELENVRHGMDRGRYAGPIGWFNGSGDGEFGIALRGGMVEDPHTLRLFAGGGIVAGSDPAEELAETVAKFQPMLSVLGDDSSSS